MKTLKCDICDATASGETFEDWMMALMPHYMEAHADVMKSKEGLTDQQMQEEKKKWMEDNRERFEAA